MNKEIKPLYRKRNTKVLNSGYWIWSSGGDYKYERHFYKNDFETTKLSMKKNRGADYDYTPLYWYLRKHVGENWNDIYSNILPRLPNTKEGREAWTYFVNQPYEKNKLAIVSYGPRAYYSALYIDENNLLQIVDPTIGVEHFNATYGRDFPETYTFNGKRIMKNEPDKADFDYDHYWDIRTNSWSYYDHSLSWEERHPTLKEYLEKRIDMDVVKNGKYRITLEGIGSDGSTHPGLEYVLQKYGNCRFYKIDYYGLSKDMLEIEIKDKEVLQPYLDAKKKEDKLAKKKQRKAALHPKHRKDTEIKNDKVKDDKVFVPSWIYYGFKALLEQFEDQ